MDSAPVTLALLNYNGDALVRDCVNSLHKQAVLPEKILYIDNGSTSFSENAVREIFTGPLSERLEIVSLGENRGYAGGFNAGLRHLLSRTDVSEWILTLSNDTRLDSRFFESLLAHMKPNASSRLGMLAPKIRSMHEPDQLDGTGLSLCVDGMSTARGQFEIDRGQYDAADEVICPNGVAAIYRSSLLKDVGLMDEDFESYCEDTDLGLRAWLAGWDCRHIPSAIVYHRRSSTFGMKNLRKLFLVERNHYWVAVKSFPLPLLLLNPVFTLYRFALQLYSVLSRRGQGDVFGLDLGIHRLALATLRAQAAALAGLPKMLGKRFEQKKRLRRQPEEILSWLIGRRLRLSDLILKQASPKP